jgi:hypothetical protein
MAQGSRDRVRKPVCNNVPGARSVDLDLIRELPYGPAADEWPQQRPDRCQHPTYAPFVPEDSSCTQGGVHRCCMDRETGAAGCVM